MKSQIQFSRVAEWSFTRYNSTQKAARFQRPLLMVVHPAPSPDSTSGRIRVNGGCTHRCTTRCFSSAVEVKNIVERELHEEARTSYLSYSMSVMVGRALPDARDGLKPVHRRLLFAMEELGLSSGKPFRKSARVVGDVLGKYHPHGDQAIYDALVRLAQPFSMAAPLIDGHGNFGSIDNDPAAAMRYTECRLQQLAEAMLLQDLDPEIVTFNDTFDASGQEPSVLPARIPQLLVNGSQGIAVGIATRVPPHNLIEVVQALSAVIDNPDITEQELRELVPGPDFPTGAILIPGEGVKDTYSTGKGSMTLRSKVHIDKGTQSGDRDRLVVTELPYQVPKASVIEQIAAQVEKGTLTGISDIQDESDRTGMRIVIEVKRGADSTVVLKNLFKHTKLQQRFSANMVALVDNVPVLLPLRRALDVFIKFRFSVVEKRTEQLLRLRKARLHIVEGFLKAVDSLDSVLSLIKKSSDGKEARNMLQEYHHLTSQQADAVLNMSLRRLTGLAVQELRDEEKMLKQDISTFSALLEDPNQINKVVKEEAQEIAGKFGVQRRTVIYDSDISSESSEEELIQDERCLIIITSAGHIKRVDSDSFATQRRGGKGKQGAVPKGDAETDDIITAMTLDHLICIASDGSCHRIRVFDIPKMGRTARGVPVASLLPKLKDSVSIATLVPLSTCSKESTGNLLLLTTLGRAKQIKFQDLRSVREGTCVMGLKDGDNICFASACQDNQVILLACSRGTISLCPTSDIPSYSTRTACGVIAKRLRKGCTSATVNALQCKATCIIVPGHQVIGACLVPAKTLEENPAEKKNVPCVLLASSDGYGKRVPLSAFKVTSRGKVGVIGMKMKEGEVLADIEVVNVNEESHAEQKEEDELVDAVSECLIATKNGKMTRIPIHAFNIYGRTARGVRVMNIQAGDSISSVVICKYKHD